MLDAVGFILDLIELISNLINLVLHLIAYWRFWLPVTLAVLASWGIATIVYNPSACVYVGATLITGGVIAGFVWHILSSRG